MNNENFVQIDKSDKYSLYYDIETQIISVTDGIETYGVNIDKLGDDLFRHKVNKEDKKDERG